MRPTLISPKIVPNPVVREFQVHAEDSELQDRIRVRAFELFEQRGRREGSELEDWLQAEEELTTRTLAA